MAGETLSPPRGGNGRFSRSVKTAQRDADATDLRAKGWSLQRIADELGFASKGAVHNAIRRTFRDIPSPGTEDEKRLDLDRIDRLIEQAWGVMEREHLAYSNGRVVRRRIGVEADGDGNELHDADGKPIPVYEDVLEDGPILSAIAHIRALLERRAKIFGYDAPARSRIEVITEDAVDAEILRLTAELGQHASDHPGASGEDPAAQAATGPR
jgi:hypothetical protein